MEILSIKGSLLYFPLIPIIINGNSVLSQDILRIFLWKLLRDQSDIPYTNLICVIVISFLLLFADVLSKTDKPLTHDLKNGKKYD